MSEWTNGKVERFVSENPLGGEDVNLAVEEHYKDNGAVYFELRSDRGAVLDFWATPEDTVAIRDALNEIIADQENA